MRKVRLLPERPGKFREIVSTLLVLSQLQGHPSAHIPKPINRLPALASQRCKCLKVLSSMFVVSCMASLSPASASASNTSCGKRKLTHRHCSAPVFLLRTRIFAQYEGGHFERLTNLARNLLPCNPFFFLSSILSGRTLGLHTFQYLSTTHLRG